MRFLLLFYLFNSLLLPFTSTKYEGTIPQVSQWDCGPAAAATVLHLAGITPQAWPEEKEDVSLGQLALYLKSQGLTAEGYHLNRQQLEHFFTHFPQRPLIAHLQGERGHFVVLLGLVQGQLLLADPSRGVFTMTWKPFLQDFSGYALYFPDLPELPAVGKLLAAANRRLNLLRLGAPR